MKDWIINLFTTKESREKKILRECGNVCYCPKCNEPLNDRSECVELDDKGLYQYTCTECGFKPMFHFGIAPCPIYIEETA